MSGKNEIRKRMITLRNLMPTEEREAKSLVIQKKVTDLDEIQSAATLMVFLSFGSEVMTDGLICWCWGKGKQIVVPFCHPESRELTACRIDSFGELEKGHHGIRAPKESLLRPFAAEEIDVILVPAVAFDPRGYRVGYGGGYYDRFLPKAECAMKIGIAFTCQMVEEIAVESYDVTVDRIVTEEGMIIPSRPTTITDILPTEMMV
jgi:5-formyltetrahydrofolate cyclo-ligase